MFEDTKGVIRSRVSSDPIYSYVFKILLYFLYVPKISYISSQVDCLALKRLQITQVLLK
jgi:hypothetical protein